MAQGQDSEIHRRRVALGLTTEDLARVVGLPVAQIRALEGGLVERKSDPYVKAWRQVVIESLESYEARLAHGDVLDVLVSGARVSPEGMERGFGEADPQDATVPSVISVSLPPTGPVLPRTSTRWSRLAIVSLLIAFLLDVVRAQWLMTGWQWTQPPDPPSVAVRARARKATTLAVEVDHNQVLRRPVRAGERFSWEAHSEIALSVEDPWDFEIVYNGGRIEPRGAHGHSRKMVFLSEGAADE